MTLLLRGKSAVFYRGGQISHAFAREGAEVSLTGRTLAKPGGLDGEIRAAGVSRA